MKLFIAFAILFGIFCSIEALDRSDYKALRYFDCDDDDSDDCCDDSDLSDDWLRRRNRDDDWNDEFGNEYNKEDDLRVNDVLKRHHNKNHAYFGDNNDRYNRDDDSRAPNGRKYFYGSDDCRNRHQNKGRITVRDPLHAFLNSLLSTAMEPSVMDVNKIISDIERNSGTRHSNIGTPDVPALYGDLTATYDRAFELFWGKISQYINAEAADAARASEAFFGYLNNLKWSVHDLNDAITQNSRSSSTFDRDIGGAALNVAYALIDLLNSAMQLFQYVSQASDAPNLLGKVLIEFFGVLQLTYDAVDNSDVAGGAVLGNQSRITASVRTLIFNLLTSLLSGVSDLSNIFGDGFSDFSGYFGRFNDKFTKSCSLYSSKFKEHLSSIQNLFEIVSNTAVTFNRQLQYLVNQFSGMTSENATPAFNSITSFLDGSLGNIDFLLYTLTSRVPQSLQSESNDLIAAGNSFKTTLKLLVKAITMPLSQSAFQNITQYAIQLFNEFEIFMTACYKFLLPATGYMSQVVTELMATVVYISEMFSSFLYKFIYGVNNMANTYTGQRVPYLDVLYVLKSMSSLYSAVGSVVSLSPGMYSASIESLPANFPKMSIQTDNAFKLIINAYSSQISVIPQADTRTANDVVTVLQAINYDAKQLLNSVSSGSVDSSLINRSTQKLTSDVQQLSYAISKVTKYTANNIQNANQAAVTSIFREILTSVVQIVYYIIFYVRRYLESVSPGSRTIFILESVEKAFIAAMGQSTVQLSDFNRYGDNDIQGYQQICGHVTTSVDNTADSLSKYLNGLFAQGTLPGANRPIGLPRNNLPIDLPRNNLPIELPRNNYPIELPRNNRPIDLPRNNYPIDLPRNNRPIDLPRNNYPIDLPRNNHPIQLPGYGHQTQQGQIFPEELFDKVNTVISHIDVDINNGNPKDIIEGLRNLAATTDTSFKSIVNGVEVILRALPSEWGRNTNVLRSALQNVQIKTNAFVQNVLNEVTSSGNNLPIRDVRASAKSAVSAVYDFSRAISDIVNSAAGQTSYENVLLLFTLQKILSINSQTTYYVVSAISNMLDMAGLTKNNPLGDLSNLLNGVVTNSNSFKNGFTLSSDSDVTNLYNQIKSFFDTSNSQFSSGIATIQL